MFSCNHKTQKSKIYRSVKYIHTCGETNPKRPCVYSCTKSVVVLGGICPDCNITQDTYLMDFNRKERARRSISDP